VELADAELDLATLSKATLAITGEIRTDRLVERVLAVSMENAGATRGLLLLLRDGVLRLEAAQGTAPLPSRGATLDGLTGVPTSVLQYAARTGEALVLADARLDARFAGDPALPRDRPLSVLALPLAWKGRSSGLIYLENDLTPDAFTPARRRLQELLGAQAALSLENARLYDETEAMVRSTARFVPTEFLAQLGRRRLIDVVPGDAVAMEMTVLFTDLRGFTGMTERLGPGPTFALLNAWLSRVTDVIARRGGFVHDIVGDATLALFPGVPDNAVRAAAELATIPRGLLDDGVIDAELRVGIGLHAGPVMLGTLGGERRLAISVVGDTVNTAARLETATKGVGAPALVSGALVARLRSPASFALRPLGSVALHGRAELIEVAELLDVHPPALREPMAAGRADFAAGLAAMRAGDVAAATARFEACVARCAGDAAAAGLLARLRRGGGAGGKDDVEIV
jgi:class 3 adenylate cyclase